MHVEWWYWIILGIFMLLSEALTPGGFYMIFIGIAALVTGALTPAIHTSWIEISLFAALSTILIAVFRKPLVERLKKSTPKSDVPEFVGETAKAINLIPAGKEGKIELRGSVWQAKNNSQTDIPENSACVIMSRDGLLLIVNPK
jgi:membrane protein implicated in regulation of membrane protease activity